MSFILAALIVYVLLSTFFVVSVSMLSSQLSRAEEEGSLRVVRREAKPRPAADGGMVVPVAGD